MVTLALALLLAAPPARPFADERSLLDRRLEALRRILPDGPQPSADVALIRGLAEGARLGSVEIGARAPAESPTRGDVMVDVAAVGRFSDVDRFFRQVALSHRLPDVENLTLNATPDGSLRLTAVLRLSYRPVKAPLPPPPDGARQRLAGASRQQIEQFARDQALALAKSEAVASLRRARRNPRLFLSELAAAARDRPVVLSYASVGDDFQVRGLTVGEGASLDFERRLERGFCRITDFLKARQGGCHRFEVHGRCPVVGPDAELPLPAEDPFQQDDTPCRVDRDAQRSIAVKPPKSSGKGSISLRLRDVDWADVFLALHLVTSQGFLVDGDVSGRVSLDFTNVTLDEALQAIEKSGLRVSEPGPVRRVALPRETPPHTVKGNGGTPTASFTLKRTEAREILAVMTDIDPSLASLGPPGSLGRLSVYARDVPLVDLRDAILDAVELKERLEEGRRILEPPGGSDQAVTPVARVPRERRLSLRPQDLAVLEFELAGLATSGNGWIALAYSPIGTLNAYRPGDRLSDGSVVSVESTDVGLATDEGPIHAPLPALP
jgi:hypothetical protein